MGAGEDGGKMGNEEDFLERMPGGSGLIMLGKEFGSASLEKCLTRL